jgi:hypothetical protein
MNNHTEQRYTVRQSDCRTGWYVATSLGKKVSCIYRQRYQAADHAAELNAA